MATATADTDRITELEATIAELRTALDAPRPRERERRRWGRGVLATAFVLVGALLVPVASAAGWAATLVSDTDVFVATLGPLAADHDVQAYLTDEAAAVIDDALDIPALTGDLVNGVEKLGTGPVATTALNALRGPLASGIEGLIHTEIGTFVASPAFAELWEGALRASHTQLDASLTGSSSALLVVAPDGQVTLHLAPLVDRVKQVLEQRGLAFASTIPETTRTIDLGTMPRLATVQTSLRVLVAVAPWLPWIALCLVAAGVLIAPRRALALVWAATAVALAALLTSAALQIAQWTLERAVPASVAPSDVIDTVYTALVGPMRASAFAVLTLALAVALVAVLFGPFRAAVALRSWCGSGLATLRARADAHGLGTGAAGAWTGRHRRLLLVGVAVLCSAVVLLVHPLTPALVLWTLAAGLVAALAVVVVQRPVETP